MEFAIGLLEVMGKVNQNDLLLASSLFDRLDTNEDGMIRTEEVDMIMKMKKRDDVVDDQEKRLSEFPY